MSYKLDIAVDAELDLARLVDSLPESRHARALPTIVEALQPLAAKSARTLGRPTFRFHFVIDDVHYHWAATFSFAEDEATIVVTHV